MVELYLGEKRHLSFLVECQLKLALETENLKLKREVVEKGVQAVLGDPSKGEYLICEEKSGALIGCLLLVKEWSDWRNKNILWIHSVYIKQEFRGMGHFKKMYKGVEERVLNSKELSGIRLYVDKTNKEATTVYRKLGMSDQHYNLFEWLKEDD